LQAPELGTDELLSHWIAGGKLSLSFEQNYQRRGRRFGAGQDLLTRPGP
jgi:hypothetical protein